jgi:hypothetical protein
MIPQFKGEFRNKLDLMAMSAQTWVCSDVLRNFLTLIVNFFDKGLYKLEQISLTSLWKKLLVKETEL